MSRRTRVRGLVGWSPRAGTEKLLEQVHAVLVEYREHLPLTVRQIFYRLIAAHGFDKTDRCYKRLCELLNRARRAGAVAFTSIRDDGVILHRPHGWQDRSEMVRAFLAEAERFRFDRQRDQPLRLLIAVEAGGMVPQIERVAFEYGVPVHSSGGFDSLSAKHDMACLLAEWPNAEVLHIGDHDPSGVHVFTSLAEDVRAIAHSLGSKREISFTRLVVTAAQIAELGLPTALPKTTDRRAFSGETVQAEAIPPDLLARIVREAIEERVDRHLLASILAEEQDVRDWANGELLPVLHSLSADDAP